MPTIKDVAAKASVSIKTVSRVINDEPGVADSTRQRVNDAIQQLEYVPNLSAQRLKRGKSELFALLLPRVESPYAIKLFSCILREAQKRNYSILTLPNRSGKEPANTEQIARVVKNHRVDGLIVAPPGADNLVLMNFLKLNHVPYVTINPNLLNEHPFSVESTDDIGANEATRYLISLGHKRIAHIACMKTERFSHERQKGYLRALVDVGLAASPLLILQGDNSIESGYTAAQELLNSAEPPTAIFAGNDEMAVGVILAALHLGVTIPGELSVIGFDDTPISNQIFPRLTTIAQSIPEIARVSVENLLELIDDNTDLPQFVQIPTRLVLRDSCGVPNHR
ncbi:MAG: LacI family DNA-binding transcriptional regulator [Anaerolineae bacterium]|nr:LacI family DNA-binding transcriptional regulator [Anaerolineae bacterium]